MEATGKQAEAPPRRPTKRAQARAWALLGEMGGLVMSSALNGQQAATHGMGKGPVIVAMAIPLGLFIALRVVTTAPITGRWRMLLWPGFALLVAVFAIVSFRDQRDLLVTWGFEATNDGLIPLGTASLLPLGIDGLMAVCAVALLALAALDLVKPEESQPQPEVETLVDWKDPVERHAEEQEAAWRDAATAVQGPTWDNLPIVVDPDPAVQAQAEYHRHGAPFGDYHPGGPDPAGADQDPPVKRKVDLPVAEEAPRAPRRATRAATSLPTGTRAEFLEREDPADPRGPMTWQDVVAADGGTQRSAESKMYRWRKAARDA